MVKRYKTNINSIVLIIVLHFKCTHTIVFVHKMFYQNKYIRHAFPIFFSSSLPLELRIRALSFYFYFALVSISRFNLSMAALDGCLTERERITVYVPSIMDLDENLMRPNTVSF